MSSKPPRSAPKSASVPGSKGSSVPLGVDKPIWTDPSFAPIVVAVLVILLTISKFKFPACLSFTFDIAFKFQDLQF